MSTPKQTAVDWLIEQLKELDRNGFNLQVSKLNELGMQARQMEREQLTALVQSLMDYTFESLSILGYDERDASEFVDVFLNGGGYE